jgi:hypothetical protein
MRRSDERAGALFRYVDLEAGVPAGHPLRAIREIVNQALRGLSPTFARLCPPRGRPSSPAECASLSPTRRQLPASLRHPRFREADVTHTLGADGAEPMPLRQIACEADIIGRRLEPALQET